MRVRHWIVLSTVTMLLAVIAPAATGAPRITREDVDEVRSFGLNPLIQPQEVPGLGVVGSERCTTSGTPSDDIDISCDSPIAPDNEIAIVANPDNPNHLLAGSNDYQLVFKGNTVLVRVPTGFFVSTDGGATWTDGEVPLTRGALGAGDPSPAFNTRFGTAHMASLEFTCGQGSPLCTTGNVTVSTSSDGGFTWQRPVKVASGIGSDRAAQQIFNDKEWLISDNNVSSPFYGRLYLVWVAFRLESGAYDESPVMLSYSDDAGDTWTEPKEISGRSEDFCDWQDDADDVAAGEDAFECDQDQFAYPAVASDGTLYVHFHNEQNSGAWEEGERYESQIMVVKSTDGGATFTPPVHVVQMEDSYFNIDDPDTGSDYPINVDGRTTLTGHQFRVNSAGNIAVDTSGVSDGRVYIVYADNAAGTIDVQTTPGDDVPVTDTNIYLAYSDDGGATWAGGDDGETDLDGRLVVDGDEGTDQWFPWAAVDPTSGALEVVYMDAPDRDVYDMTLASSMPDMPDSFSYEQLNTAPSRPDDSVWFTAGVEDCPFCATFIGDYNGADVDTSSRVHGVWTDLRRPILEVDSTPLHTQDAFYARRD